MCTAFVRKGDDLIVGFNFDLCENAFTYKICKRKDVFFIGIVMGSTTYKTHGVNRNGNAGNLPYMNDAIEQKRKQGKHVLRLDLLNDSFIAGKRTYAELLDDVKTKEIVSPKGMSMHTQFSDASGHILLVEPGIGYREVDAPYSILSNFPVLKAPMEPGNPFYGTDRYETGRKLLENSTDAFNVSDGLRLLEATKQGGSYATRVSYVYSRNENAVYYALQGDFDRIERHGFA